MPELVSIVVCAYNNWPDLELAIQSALCQSHQPVEVVVVDNSSTDATPVEVRARFGARIRYIRQANLGDSGAYNTGLKVARGEFLQFLDGDDVLAPNKIEKQLEVFRWDPDAEIVFGGVRHFQSLAGEALGSTPIKTRRMSASNRSCGAKGTAWDRRSARCSVAEPWIGSGRGTRRCTGATPTTSCGRPSRDACSGVVPAGR